MRTFVKHIFLIIICLVQILNAGIEAQDTSENARERILFDPDWLFALGHATDAEKDFGNGTSYFSYFAKAGYGDGAASAGFDDRAWRHINLPHDWCIELPFDARGGHSHGYKAIGREFPENSVGWYRKKFKIPGTDFGKLISIEFDGVFRNSVVWVNGFYLGTEESGYTSFAYDITDYLNYGGINVIAVRADATMEEGWFYEGAGIYRHVWLTKTSPLHVERFGTFITTELVNRRAVLTIQTSVKNDFNNDVQFSIEESIVDSNGEIVLSESLKQLSLTSFQTGEFRSEHTITDPLLWTIDSPAMHKLITVIKSNNLVVDKYETPFGIRTVRFDPDSGFFLNNKKIKILGTNNHQDHAGVGAAIPDALQEFRINKLKEIGSNAIRTSHNPPTPEFLDACDKLGMLVLNENRLMGTNQEHLYLLEQFIKRDRNHPSVILWSLGNEEWAIEGNKTGIRITETMQSFAQKLDSSRAFTVACSGGWDSGIGTVSEVMGYNYLRHGNIDEHHKKFPWQPGVGTEETTASGTRGIYFTDGEKAHQAPGSFDSEYGGVEYGWKFYNQRPFLAGLFYWTGFDYHGEPNPYGWPQVTSQFGIMDLCGYPKDAFHYLKSWWCDEPYLRISPHWNLLDKNIAWKGKAGNKVKVSIYSNADEIELLLNEKSIGRKRNGKNEYLTFNVSYQPGKLTAIGFENGKEITRSSRITAGSPASIEMTADKTAIEADGKDISIITVSVRDKEDNIVPTAESDILFNISGPGQIIGVGNGNPSSHEPEKYFETIITSKINDLKETVVDDFKNRAEVLTDYNDSQWIDAFSNESEDWMNYTDSMLVIRGIINLLEFDRETEVNLFTKSIVENQSVYVNGHLIASDVKRDSPGQSYMLSHDLIKPGKNIYAVTGKRFKKKHQWDEPNRDPGLVQLIYPAEQWKRKLFNGLAQVIIQSDTTSGSIVLKASSHSLNSAEIRIKTK